MCNLPTVSTFSKIETKEDAIFSGLLTQSLESLCDIKSSSLVTCNTRHQEAVEWPFLSGSRRFIAEPTYTLGAIEDHGIVCKSNGTQGTVAIFGHGMSA